jgi:Uma2 family endonuclease
MSSLDLIDEIHRYSVDEYEEMVKLGAFEDQRVELIDGYVVDLGPMTERHMFAHAWLNEWLVLNLDRSRFWLYPGGAVRVDPSEPQPDLMVVDREDPGGGVPRRSHLVVEVAVSSQHRDLKVKPRVYAPAIAEYWVFDVDRGCFVVHRDPTDDGYRSVTIHGREATIQPSAIGLPPLVIAELLDALPDETD